MATDEINVPSLVLILVVSGFLIRHFFFRGSPSTAGERGASDVGARGAAGQSRDQRRAEALDRRIEAAVEHIQQIFPYADRRDIWWDLRRNGLNVAATTERILAGRLDTVSQRWGTRSSRKNNTNRRQPPITFQPPAPSAPSAHANTSATRAAGNGSVSGAAAGVTAGATASGSSKAKSGQPNLIQRYNLENKVAETSDTPSTPSSASSTPSGTKTKNWSSNRDERQNLLKKRRDDMILEARRKMEAKIAAEKVAAAAGDASTSS
ncbi:hypothetical protein SEUCBS140593_000056 [Sporothrix eucalyptigena]|uniref:CUE domain-containing protein n=1 Tax=Sporothrix eucalyptigena TaxID=1812306 RepID=A0ABP0ALN5_9PEZI